MRDGWAGWWKGSTSIWEKGSSQEPGGLANPGSSGVIDPVLQRTDFRFGFNTQCCPGCPLTANGQL
jgi:hypothetical protein